MNNPNVTGGGIAIDINAIRQYGNTIALVYTPNPNITPEIMGAAVKATGIDAKMWDDRFASF